MKKFTFLASIILLSVNLSSRQLSPGETVLNRAREFQSGMNLHDSGKIWELSTPRFKNRNPKDKYESEMSPFLVELKTKAEEPSIIAMGDKWAMTQSVVNATFFENGRELYIKTCNLTIWLKYPDNWYWMDTGYACHYAVTVTDEMIQSWVWSMTTLEP